MQTFSGTYLNLFGYLMSYHYQAIMGQFVGKMEDMEVVPLLRALEEEIVVLDGRENQLLLEREKLLEQKSKSSP